MDTVRGFVALAHTQIKSTVFLVKHAALPMHPPCRIRECMLSFCFLGFPHSGLRSLPGSTSDMHLARMHQNENLSLDSSRKIKPDIGTGLLMSDLVCLVQFESPGYDGAGKVCWFDVAFVHSRQVSEH